MVAVNDPSHPTDLTETARLIDEGRYEVANGLLRLALLQALSPEDSLEAFLQLARLHARRGEPRAAKQFLDRVLLEAPEHPGGTSVLREISAAEEHRGRPRLGLIVAVLVGSLIAAAMVWIL